VAGLLVLDLDRLAVEAEAARVTLTNGSGRRARATARTTLSRLERRGMRLRASLESAERRIADLAGGTANRPLDLARALTAAPQGRA
jgi:hypothetical protein